MQRKKDNETQKIRNKRPKGNQTSDTISAQLRKIGNETQLGTIAH